MTSSDYVLPNHITDRQKQLEHMNRVLTKEIELLNGNVEALQKKVAVLTNEIARLSAEGE